MENVAESLNKASLNTGDMDKFYYESCETAFKLRYNNHNQSFKYNRKINSTELSKAVWKLQQPEQLTTIRWNIGHHATLYQCSSKTCNLCLTEKLQMLRADYKKLLINTRNWSRNVDIEVNLNYKILITLAVNKYIY